MTTPDISKEAVAAMLDGVTPEPWWTVSTVVHIGGLGDTYPDGEPRWGGFDLRNLPDAEANARFIAYAREAVPALAAERDDLAARVAELEAALDEINGCHTFALGELSAAEAEIARLREVVTAEIDAHSRYEELPVDRGGKVGPKGLAFAAWLAARASVIAALQEKPE